MMRLLPLFAIIFITALPRAECFSPPGHALLPTATRSSQTTRLSSTDDKQAEIAALEEKLRQLKEVESSPQTAADDVSLSSEMSDDELDGVELEGESEDSVMFSERWKEAKDDYITKKEENAMENAMGGIGKVGLALAFVVFLGIFSQVPVGEDSLQRYQDVKGNPSRIDLGDLNTQ